MREPHFCSNVEAVIGENLAQVLEQGVFPQAVGGDGINRHRPHDRSLCLVLRLSSYLISLEV